MLLFAAQCVYLSATVTILCFKKYCLYCYKLLCAALLHNLFFFSPQNKYNNIHLRFRKIKSHIKRDENS